MDGSCAGMMVHSKTEQWLSFPGQVAQFGPDYSAKIK